MWTHVLVVQEAAVLLGVKHLKESTCGITVVTLTDFVNFIDEYEGVFRLNALEGLDDLAGERTEVPQNLTAT